jgi:hypothetical protein
MTYDPDLDLDLYGDDDIVPALDAFHDDVDDTDLDDTGDFTVIDSGDADDDADAWVREHVNVHGPTAEGFRLLGEMEDNGEFV